MRIRQARRLSTLMNEARENGLFGVITRDSVVVSPRTGNVIKNYGKNVLHVYDQQGQPVFVHYSGIGNTSNNRVENKLNIILGRNQDIPQESSPE